MVAKRLTFTHLDVQTRSRNSLTTHIDGQILVSVELLVFAVDLRYASWLKTAMQA